MINSTTAKSTFNIYGGVKSVFGMDVSVRLSHDCDRWLPCQREVTFFIPDHYVERRLTVEKWFDLGTLNMEVRVSSKL